MTPMRWRKHGLVWCPDGSLPWARGWAACPTPLRRRDGTLRVFVQCRDEQHVGRVGWVDLDPEDPRRVRGFAREPVLDVGVPGTFDDNGVLATCALPLPDGRVFLYYVGFELCHRVRYRLLSGLAVSEDDGASFRRLRTTPILERSPSELHFRGGPFVLREPDGRFRIWYVAGSGWETLEGKPMPVYELRHAESADGIHWPDEGRVVLRIDPATEHGLGRPFVRRLPAGGYEMHYSVRRRSPARYRMGRATSADGLHWQRADAALGLDVTPGAFDGEAIEYGAPVEAGGRSWLLYNGNEFGRAGFAVAERLQD